MTDITLSTQVRISAFCSICHNRCTRCGFDEFIRRSDSPQMSACPVGQKA